jgi:hypothetical protein
MTFLRTLSRLILPLAGLTGCSVILPKNTGVPFCPSARAGRFVVTLISTLEPSIPSLHHRPENDRHSVSLLLHSIDGKDRRVIPFATGLATREFFSNARILADDGRMVWFHAGSLGAYDYHSGKLYHERDLPGGSRGGPQRGGIRLSELNAKYDSFLAPTSNYGPGVRASLIYNAPMQGKPVLLDGPPSHLLLYLTNRSMQGTWAVARVPATPGSGDRIWEADTGIVFMDQILPGTESTAFIGRGPQVPGKLQEPFLVQVDHRTGAVSRSSLWVK